MAAGVSAGVATGLANGCLPILRMFSCTCTCSCNNGKDSVDGPRDETDGGGIILPEFKIKRGWRWGKYYCKTKC